MLACIPPKPEYDQWLRICSSVFATLPMEPACRLLNAWSPEEREGEYAKKHKARLAQVTTGTLVHIAKQHGWKGTRSAGRVKIAPAVSLSEGTRQALAKLPRPSWLPEKLAPIPARRPQAVPTLPRPPAAPVRILASPQPPAKPARPLAPKPLAYRAPVPAGRCVHCWHHWGRCLIDGHCICTGNVAIRPGSLKKPSPTLQASCA